MWSRARDGEWARVRVDDAEKATSGIRLSSRPTARKHEETGEELATKERHSVLSQGEEMPRDREKGIVSIRCNAERCFDILRERKFDSLRRFSFWIS